MKTTLLLLLILLFNIEASAQQEICGKWKIGTSKSTVEISPQKNNFKGKIIKVTKENHQQEVEQLILTNVKYVDMLDLYTCKIKITNGFAANCEFKFLNSNNTQLQMTAKFLFFTKSVLFQKND